MYQIWIANLLSYKGNKKNDSRQRLCASDIDKMYRRRLQNQRVVYWRGINVKDYSGKLIGPRSIISIDTRVVRLVIF